MKHITVPDFWQHYNRLPKEIRDLADKNYVLLQSEPRHTSLHFKKIGNGWSVRIGSYYRALAFERPGEYVWFWIGPHSEYDHQI